LQPSPAHQYLDEALTLIEAHALQASRIEWASLREALLRDLHNAQIPADVYNAIRFVLHQLKDNHSTFAPPDAVRRQKSGGLDNLNVMPHGDIIDGFGYITLPSFTGSDTLALEYASTAHLVLRTLRHTALPGWIIDLTQNTGGNMWPMIASIGPLLGHNPCGYFVAPDSHRYASWLYRTGYAGNEHIQTQFIADSICDDFIPPPPVALLIDQTTASAGEAVAVAFHGRSQTRSFGTPPAGRATANQPFHLRDGACIYLTVCRFADRNEQIMNTTIDPDERVDNPSERIPRAIDWLKQQMKAAD
jgi:carboxyl-terminal processing protease